MTVEVITGAAMPGTPSRNQRTVTGSGLDFNACLAGLIIQSTFTPSTSGLETAANSIADRSPAGRKREVSTTGPGAAEERRDNVAGPDRGEGNQVGDAGRGSSSDRMSTGGIPRQREDNHTAAVNQSQKPSTHPGTATEKATGSTAGPGNSQQDTPVEGRGPFKNNGADQNRVQEGWPLFRQQSHSPGWPDQNRVQAGLPGKEKGPVRAGDAGATVARSLPVRHENQVTGVAREGKEAFTTANISGLAGKDGSPGPESPLLNKGTGRTVPNLKPDIVSGMKAAGDQVSRQVAGATGGQEPAVNGSKPFFRESGDQAVVPGNRQGVIPLPGGAPAGTGSGGSPPLLAALYNAPGATNPGPGQGYTGAQKNLVPAGGTGVTDSGSLLAGQVNFNALLPATGQQSGGQALPVSNMPEVMATLMAAVRMSRTGGQQELEIQLRPENLGHLKLRATLEGGRLVLHLLVENNDAARALQAAVPEMRQAAAGQGLRLDQVQVQVNGEGPGSGYQTGSRGDQGQGAPGWHRGTPAWTGHEGKEAATSTWYRLDYLA